LQIVDPHTAANPDQDGVLWTNRSRPKIAEELLRRGFRVSVTVVSQLLERHRLGSRKACKTLPLGRHVNRDRQFQIITNHRTAFMQSPDPIVSMDTKLFEVQSHRTPFLPARDACVPKFAADLNILRCSGTSCVDWHPICASTAY